MKKDIEKLFMEIAKSQAKLIEAPTVKKLLDKIIAENPRASKEKLVQILHETVIKDEALMKQIDFEEKYLEFLDRETKH